MKITLVILALLSFSCTHMRERKEQQRSWVGRPSQELERHPLFTKLDRKSEKGAGDSEIKTFADGYPMLTKARCGSLSGCTGFSDNWCEHIFTIKNKIIEKYTQYGPCPYNENANP